jgi:hypothetical protein
MPLFRDVRIRLIAFPALHVARQPRGHGGTAVIRWKVRYMRVAVAVAAFASIAIASGAGARWS